MGAFSYVRPMISKLRWKLSYYRLMVLGFLLRPRFIIDPYENRNVSTHVVTYNDVDYNVVETRNARIYTNNINNITVIVNGGIEPLTSWHCEGWETLPPAENKLVTGELKIDRLPMTVNTTVAVLLCGQVGHYNYFHWLYDVLPRLQLIEGFVGRDECVKVLLPQLALPFQKQSLDLLGLQPSNVITSTDCSFIQARKLITTTHPIHTSWHPPAWTIDFLRSRFLPAVSDASAGSRIYITRGDSSNGRVLLNEATLLKALENLGFQSLTLSELNLADQIAIFSRAQVVVGVHGAGLTNLTFCRPGTKVYELACEQYPNTIFEAISDHLSLEHHYILCEVPDPTGLPMVYNLRLGDEAMERLRVSLDQH
jgi:hypothetical protein